MQDLKVRLMGVKTMSKYDMAAAKALYKEHDLTMDNPWLIREVRAMDRGDQD